MRSWFFKVFVFIVLSLSVVIPFGNAKAFNVPGKTIDQACTTQSQGTVYASMDVVGTIEIFFPTMDTLDATAALISAPPGKTVSVKAVIFHNTPAGSMLFATSTNTANVTDSPSWQVFEMDDIPMPSGLYSFRVYATERDEEVFWYAKDSGDCYPNGYAVIDSQVKQNEDFNFVIFGKNSGGGGSVAPGGSTSTDTSTSNPTTSNPTGPDATVPDTTGKDTTETDTTASANKQSADSKAVMSNPKEQEEFSQEMVAAILADFKQHQTKGIFGIGGIMGDILTWTNIGIFFGVIAFIVLCFFLLIHFRRPAEKNSFPSEKNK